MMSEDEAAIFAGATTEAIERLARTGALHSTVAANSMLLICLDSLLRAQHPEKVIETSLTIVTPQGTQQTG